MRGGGGMPSPGAIRGEISGLQKQQGQMETGASKMETQLVTYERNKAQLINEKQNRIGKRNEYSRALSQMPSNHPQRAELQQAVAALDASVKQIDEQINKLNSAIDQLRQNLRTMRERRGMLQSAIGQRRSILVQLAARQLAQKKQQQQQKKQGSQNREQGKQKG
jgi:chromosome segregation ATPase